MCLLVRPEHRSDTGSAWYLSGTTIPHTNPPRTGIEETTRVETPDITAIPGYTAGTWVADAVHSEVGFSVRHMMVSNVRGRFTDFEATITMAPNPLDSTATATIRLGSVETGNAKRDEDLRSGGFLDVENHPEMTFSSTGVRAGDGVFFLDRWEEHTSELQ